MSQPNTAMNIIIIIIITMMTQKYNLNAIFHPTKSKSARFLKGNNEDYCIKKDANHTMILKSVMLKDDGDEVGD